MKKLSIIGMLTLILVALTFSFQASAATKKNLTLDLPTSVYANNKRVATIHGKTKPNAKVKIGTFGKSVKANKKGEFTLKYKISKKKAEKVIKITSKIGKNKVSKKVTIKKKSSNKPKASTTSEKDWDNAGQINLSIC
ncbi:hypothetical protein [Lactococcus allomyrinae]|uniref:Bacterial Ig domain-containing protein n=1 Tax=Lactococcus allomyrinae TaxID=2419773 RepID=A0A387BKW2_9LACT|nr:hypothetical protein [Lactococcus allomyrinae]AYG01677.1 hypothetical protein D7I46_11805 [Lactococcus allomyrinae]